MTPISTKEPSEPADKTPAATSTIPNQSTSTRTRGPGSRCRANVAASHGNRARNNPSNLSPIYRNWHKSRTSRFTDLSAVQLAPLSPSYGANSSHRFSAPPPQSSNGAAYDNADDVEPAPAKTKNGPGTGIKDGSRRLKPKTIRRLPKLTRIAAIDNKTGMAVVTQGPPDSANKFAHSDGNLALSKKRKCSEAGLEGRSTCGKTRSVDIADSINTRCAQGEVAGDANYAHAAHFATIVAGVGSRTLAAGSRSMESLKAFGEHITLKARRIAGRADADIRTALRRRVAPTELDRALMVLELETWRRNTCAWDRTLALIARHRP
jgi:hypothetical protein